MKQAVVAMFLVLFSWIWNLVPWTASDLVPTARSSGPTTSFSANLALETTGPKAITLKELNSSIRFSMWFEKKLRTVIACKVWLLFLCVFLRIYSFGCVWFVILGSGFCRVSSVSLTRRRNWVWNGYPFDLKDQRGIPRSDDAYFLGFSISKGVRHCCWALQCNLVCSPTRWERWWVYGSW